MRVASVVWGCLAAGVFAPVAAGQAPTILQARLLDLQGQPVAKEPVAVLFVHERGMAQQEVTTSASGSLQVAVAETFVRSASRVFVVRRGGEDGADTVYGGMAVYQLPADAMGLIAAGDLRLQEEPLVFAGRLVDAAGAPVAGVVVAMARTWSDPLGERLAANLPRGVLGRALLHRCTTDAQGRFAFREREPKPGAVQLDIGDGAWLGEPGLVANVGQLEQVIVVGRSASLRVDFRTRPPHSLRVELHRSGTVLARGARRDEPTGSWAFEQIHAGRYDVRVLVQQKEQLRIADVEVREGQACADPRLRDVDWSVGLQVVQLRVHHADGSAFRGASLQPLDAKGRATGGLFAMPSDTEAVVLAEGQQRFVVMHERYQTVLVERPLSEVPVTLAPRRRVHLTLHEDLELPTGLTVELHALAFPAKLGPPSRALWTGPTNEILADGPGRHRITLSTLVERSPVILWSGEIEVGAGTEPAAVVLPIQARAVKELRQSFAELGRK